VNSGGVKAGWRLAGHVMAFLENAYCGLRLMPFSLPSTTMSIKGPDQNAAIIKNKASVKKPITPHSALTHPVV